MQVSNVVHAPFICCPQRREPLVHNDTPDRPHALHTFVHSVVLTGSNRLSYRDSSRSLRENRLGARKGKACARLCGLGASDRQGQPARLRRKPLFLPRRQARPTWSP